MGLAARNIEPDITTGDAGRVALTFFFNLMEHWGCSKEQQGAAMHAAGGHRQYHLFQIQKAAQCAVAPRHP